MIFRFLLAAAVALEILLPGVASARGATDPAREVPSVVTPLGRTDIADVLLRGHVRELGVAPSASRLAMAWAQVALENGNGKYSYDHNLGNIGPWTPAQAWYLSPLDKNFYRAFDTFEEAATAYWRVVRKCPGALARFDAGFAEEAAKLLRQCGYFGADLATYAKAMASLYQTGKPFAEAALARWARPPNQEIPVDAWLDDD